MSKTYYADYSHGTNMDGGRLTLDAETAEQAKREVRDFVRSGYRNGTTASVEIEPGVYYTASNKHGRVVARVQAA